MVGSDAFPIEIVAFGKGTFVSFRGGNSLIEVFPRSELQTSGVALKFSVYRDPFR